MRKFVVAVLTVGVLAVPAAAQASTSAVWQKQPRSAGVEQLEKPIARAAGAVLWLSGGEARGQIRRWGRDTATDKGDTITKAKADTCVRRSATNLQCWYSEDGFDVDGYDYECYGVVRVLEYSDRYNIAPIRHGRFRFRCRYL